MEGKKWLKCFLQSPTIGAPTLLDRSYRHWQILHELLGDYCFHWHPQSSEKDGKGSIKGIDYMGLNRLLNMIIIFMTFWLTYYWLLIFVFRYKEAQKLLSSYWWFKTIQWFTSVGKIKTFFFSLCLIPWEIRDIWVLNTHIKVKRTVSRHIQKSQSILGSSKRNIHPTVVGPMVSIMFHWILSSSFIN